jgi:hypothetical protein
MLLGLRSFWMPWPHLQLSVIYLNLPLEPHFDSYIDDHQGELANLCIALAICSKVEEER